MFNEVREINNVNNKINCGWKRKAGQGEKHFVPRSPPPKKTVGRTNRSNVKSSMGANSFSPRIFVRRKMSAAKFMLSRPPPLALAERSKTNIRACSNYVLAGAVCARSEWMHGHDSAQSKCYRSYRLGAGAGARAFLARFFADFPFSAATSSCAERSHERRIGFTPSSPTTPPFSARAPAKRGEKKRRNGTCSENLIVGATERLHNCGNPFGFRPKQSNELTRIIVMKSGHELSRICFNNISNCIGLVDRSHVLSLLRLPRRRCDFLIAISNFTSADEKNDNNYVSYLT